MVDTVLRIVSTLQFHIDDGDMADTQGSSCSESGNAKMDGKAKRGVLRSLNKISTTSYSRGVRCSRRCSRLACTFQAVQLLLTDVHGAQDLCRYRLFQLGAVDRRFPP